MSLRPETGTRIHVIALSGSITHGTSETIGVILLILLISQMRKTKSAKFDQNIITEKEFVPIQNRFVGLLYAGGMIAFIAE